MGMEGSLSFCQATIATQLYSGGRPPESWQWLPPETLAVYSSLKLHLDSERISGQVESHEFDGHFLSTRWEAAAMTLHVSSCPPLLEGTGQVASSKPSVPHLYGGDPQPSSSWKCWCAPGCEPAL